MTPEEHATSVAAWWRERDRRLRDPDGWLTLVGLHWLAPGENRFGAAPDNDVVLHGTEVPPHAGSLWVRDGAVFLRSAGEAAEERLAGDVGGEPTMVDLGNLRMHVIERGDRLGLRVRDRASPALAAFAGMRHYPVDPSWRITGRLEPAEPSSTIEIMDIIGLATPETTPGTFVFERDGRTWRMVALPAGEDGSLWLIFGDATNGSETYGGGRYLISEPVAGDGSVVADFNLAYNPPCVFTPFATCPLPPPPNRLPLRIEAGELAVPPG